ncbi:hypothetical protein EJB05_10431, partial [Eragrostis curvula]
MASRTLKKSSSQPPTLDQIGSKPLVIRFSDGDEAKIMDPFDDGFPEATLELEMLKGKEHVACLEGEWLLMFDADTDECFLMSLSSLSKISLPPLVTKDFVYKAALSSPTPPDCTIMIIANEDDTEYGNYLLYCRPGDEEWQEWRDDTDDAIDFNTGIVGSRGTMYLSTIKYTFIAIDASLSSSSDYKANIKRRGIPNPSIMRWARQYYLVQSDGDVFHLQFYTHGLYNSEVIDMDIHRLDTSEYVWNKVESIGDRAIFIGGNCVVLSSASRAGIQPGYVYLLYDGCLDGIILYTIRLDDRTMTCTLLPSNSSDRLYWVVPSSFKKESNETVSTMSSKTNKKSKLIFDEDAPLGESPWFRLPVEMVEELVSRISFSDYLNVRQVCKGWSSIVKPFQFAERYPIYPMLMSICSSTTGVFKMFDPIVEWEYTVKNSSLAPCTDYQMLLFAKHGWVLVMRGQNHMYAANPFNGERVDLPEIPWPGNQFDGVSFSSTPNSPDCTVCCIHKKRTQGRTDSLYVMVWRVGDEHWTKEVIGDETQFRTAYNNPVFYHGEFYCLGTSGQLGIFNPDNMTWRVLDKPEPVLDDDPLPGDRYCHLLEFRDDLIAIFRQHNDRPIDLYRLDKSHMAWTKVEKLDGEVIFVDNWNVVMVPAPRDDCCNKIYMPKQGRYVENGAEPKSTFYDIKSRKYYPGYYGLTERMNSIWVEPKFRHK